MVNVKYRNMGKHGIKLSEISIGTMYHGSYYSKKVSHEVLSTSLDQGINFIDSADRYGIMDSELTIEQRTRAEKIISEFIIENKIDRDDLVLSSKVFKKLRDSVNSGGLSRKHVRESITDSLKYLNTDYLDLYYCHRADRNTPLEETIRTMTNLIDEGLIHYWGTSWWPPFLIERAIGIAKEAGLIPPSVEEPPYHINARFIEVDLFDVAEFHGLGITSFEALGTGFYTGKYLELIPEGSRAAIVNHIPKEVFEQRKAQIIGLKEIAQEINASLAQLMLAWTLRNPLISSTIMGGSKPEHVIENSKASGIVLEQDILEKIEDLVKNKPSIPYRNNQEP